MHQQTSNDEKEKIKEEAKQILEKFAKALARVKPGKSRKKSRASDGLREEGSSAVAEEKFRKIMFENAPKKEGGSIIAEKKSW